MEISADRAGLARVSVGTVLGRVVLGRMVWGHGADIHFVFGVCRFVYRYATNDQLD